ncbi:hypothetical protein DMC47_13380 [Nostoc sp. 3335mG]|nr:hypothetical protein DMC47_13380 [Nostoc sp. 3335mG]
MTKVADWPADGEMTIEVAPRMVLLLNGLGLASVTLATLLPVGAVLYWLTVDATEVRGFVGLAPDVLPDIGMGQRIGAALVMLVATLPMAWGLTRLRTCLAGFAAGRPFAASGIRGLRDFALGGTLAAVTQLISHTALGLVLTWTAAPGHRQLVVRIDSEFLLLAMFAGIVAALAWAMEKAAAIAQENSQFI